LFKNGLQDFPFPPFLSTKSFMAICNYYIGDPNNTFQLNGLQDRYKITQWERLKYHYLINNRKTSNYLRKTVGVLKLLYYPLLISSH
jgi:hypothetical protein